ncbi:hypothetical protein [Micromonospora sediminicola]|uniref:hypothetical protein n=1 Tax=Micromonospora sediminicola TaxID=946078 RepID=UPI0037BB1C5E
MNATDRLAVGVVLLAGAPLAETVWPFPWLGVPLFVFGVAAVVLGLLGVVGRLADGQAGGDR